MRGNRKNYYNKILKFCVDPQGQAQVSENYLFDKIG